ncbi:MAG: LLM class flavin-dependent oxidoreductase [Alphaproteobacteria bacterium]|nr:LLM class flavin-dependent oxidoreductase [Alphaproteobacteria bacterium]
MLPPGLPRIGVRLDQELDPHRCIELAVVAEASGYSSLWFAENPLHRAILPAVSACALRTERIRLGIGIINTYQHHPSLIAMEAGALDELARGRILLGIGSGVGSRIARLGFDYHPVSALRDATQIIRTLLRGEETSYRGRSFCVDRVALRFQPPRPDMPIYFASMGDRSLALCGELADGLIVSHLCPPGYTRRAVGIVKQSASAAGRKEPEVVQYVPCVVRADRDEALHFAKSAGGEMLTAFWPVGSDWPELRETIVRHSGLSKSEMLAALARLRRGEPPEGVLDDRFVEAFAIAGTAEECLATAARYGDAGVNELVLTFVGAQAAEQIGHLGRALAEHRA